MSTSCGDLEGKWRQHLIFICAPDVRFVGLAGQKRNSIPGTIQRTADLPLLVRVDFSRVLESNQIKQRVTALAVVGVASVEAAPVGRGMKNDRNYEGGAAEAIMPGVGMPPGVGRPVLMRPLVRRISRRRVLPRSMPESRSEDRVNLG